MAGTIVTSAGIGIIPSGDNSVVIDHTLGSMPTAVLTTPMESCVAPIEVLQSSIGAANFTVRFVGGVVLGVDAKFSWVVI